MTGTHSKNWIAVVAILALGAPLHAGFQYTGSMTSARNLHGSSLLASGQVLVSGGMGNGSTLGGCELYDPAHGTWTTTGPLNIFRHSHTSTLLPSGKVLVAGGTNDVIVQLSAEVYDPVAGTWTMAGPMSNPRYGHTATLLPSGRVLVTGGLNANIAVNTAEIYDPATDSWTLASPLVEPRSYHTATLLPSGLVLVAGGANSLTTTLTAEIYDPSTDGWTLTGSMATARNYHTATLLPSGLVLVAGGTTGTVTSPTAELYDPATGAWTATGSMADARNGHSASLLTGGEVLVVGGTGGTAILDRAELYVAGSWIPAGSLNLPRYYHRANLLATGSVLISGGQAQSVTNTAELQTGAAGNAGIVTGAGPGPANSPVVKTWDHASPPVLVNTWLAYGSPNWGVNVATVDMMGGGLAEIATGPGPGANYGPQVRGWDVTGTPISGVNFFAYGTLRFGVFATGGDVDGDGHAEILSAPGPGAVFGPHIRGWNYDGISLSAIQRISFFAYSTLKYGARASGGQLDLDLLTDEITTGAGAGVVFSPHVRGFNYDATTITSTFSFFAYTTGQMGATVTTAGFAGAGIDDVVVARGPDPNSDSEVKGFATSGTVTNTFAVLARPGAFGGAEVGAGDLDGDGVAELVAAPGWLAVNPSDVAVFEIVGTGATQTEAFAAYAGEFYGTKVAVGATGTP